MSTQEELREELRMAMRTLHGLRLQLAKFGINAPPHMSIEAEDLEERVAQLQSALGLAPTEPRILPQPVRPPRREPEPQFEERMRAREVGARQHDIEHQMTLLNIHRRNLGLLRQQAKALGAHAPFYIQSQIIDAQASIAGIKDTLRSHYGYAVEDLPGD